MPADILREPKPAGPAAPPPPAAPPDAGEPTPPANVAEWYQQQVGVLLPKFDAATKAAQESIVKRQTDLAGVRGRIATAPGVPEPPALPEQPPAPKITARPFLESAPGEPAVQSLNKAMAGFGLLAQMAVGIAGGFPSGALSAYTGALTGWKQGDLRRGAEEWKNYMAELGQYDRDVRNIRQQYDDVVKKWAADQERMKLELGILAAEHNLGREAIELSFKDPERALAQVNTTAKVLGDMQRDAANIAFKNMEWISDRAYKADVLAQKERHHQQEMEAKAKEQAPKLSDQSTMRQQFLAQSKDFVTVRDSFARLNAAAKNPSAAGDLAMIFNYMKMLDPGSVVRETEFANAQNAAGVPEQIRAQWNRVLRGERLTDVTRQDFLTQAGGQYQAQLGGQRNLEEQYRKISAGAGMDPSQIVVDFTGSVAVPDAGARMPVIGPNGETGTVPVGTALPTGWKAR